MVGRPEERLAQRLTGVLEESAEDLYEDAPCGYLSALPDGTIARVNRTFLSWTGYRLEDLVGHRRFQDLLAPGDRIYHETHYAPLLRMQGEVRGIAVEIVRHDGGRIPALINSVVKRDDSGRPVVVRTTIFDATDRRTYERELLRAKEQAEASEARARLLAQTLQESLIPPAPPSIPGLDVGAAYRPAGHGDEVGGDFYDVFEGPGGEWLVVLGDVAGKGATAAVVTALARYTIRAAAVRTPAPREVLGLLNRALITQSSERLCSVVYATIPARAAGSVSVTVSSGGHPLPLRLSPDGTVAPVGRPGLLLGVTEDPVLHDATVELGSGDALVFYTDGVPEGRRGEEWFGEERLAAWLGRAVGLDARAIAGGLLQEVVAFQAGLPRDDVAIVVVRVPESVH